MAYNDQNEYPVGDDKNKSDKFIPRYFRTLPNKKFLESTLDQIIQPGTAEKLNSYYGDITAKGYTATDTYIQENNKLRNDYQFTPATVVEDELDNVLFYKDYIDYINQVNNLKGTTANHNHLNEHEYYSLDLHIDFDKFVNFREYYWLPYGPQTISIAGQSKDVVSTYTVSKQDNDDNFSYVFSPDGLTNNPDLSLIRGQKYVFEFNDISDMPLIIRVQRPGTEEFTYNDGVEYFEDRIEFTVPVTAPDVLYYVNENDVNASGIFKILDLIENSSVDVEQEILGKKTYTSGNKIRFSNGMKVTFAGDVTPEKYATGQWYVEGVGDAIKLVHEDDLFFPSSYNADLNIPFDSDRFDRLPWEDASGYAGTKDYIVSNRASHDKSYWARSNRWFHRSVIEQAAIANDQVPVINETLKAKRPIIEFEAGLKLSNFGTVAKQDVDLIDDITTDVFSIIEGTTEYNIDGIDIQEGMRILFTADTDVLVKNKIYEVKRINFNNNQNQISLIETADSDPLVHENVLVKNGVTNKGYIYFFDGTNWVEAQEKEQVNQSPYFDLCTQDGVSINSLESVNQIGSKIVSYQENTATTDTELGFGITYRSLENIGDIVFKFNLLDDTITYQVNNQQVSIESDQLLLKRYTTKDDFNYVNAWTKAKSLSKQLVIRQYIAEEEQTTFEIDVYDNSANLTDLYIRVYKNDKLLVNTVDYDIINFDNIANVILKTSSNTDDVILLKTYSNSPKNNNGYYDLPIGLQNNPNNKNMESFTFGEMNDHVSTIVESIENIGGVFPGSSNLRDFGKIANLGSKFVKHSGLFNLANFHLNDESANIVSAIEFNKKEYSKFKREFLDVASTLGYDGPTKDHVDLILQKINYNKNNSMPFYFSDMLGYNNAVSTEHKVFDTNNRFYPLSKIFTLDNLSIESVNVYRNDIQIAHGRDYTFNTEGFIVLSDDYVVEYNDIIEIYEYSTTDGSYIPPTPTKLGLYPKYVPEIYVDDTYKEPRKVIQGHDGSIRIAYNDFRDNLLLELEMRIYNNVKVEYDEKIFDIYDYVPGEFRTTKFTKQQIDNVYIDDFVNWLNLVGNPDYTEYDSFFNSGDAFTFNYYASNSPNLNTLPGYWRGIYVDAFDTDRPHTHPWEILGFSIEPKWWKEVYGPRPYTVDNSPMWQDLEKGIVREPNKPLVIRDKFKRPGLSGFPPVDEQGRLQNPLNSGYLRNFSNNSIKSKFKFGDYAPVESAWRRSSNYPFALLKSLIVNRPSHVFGVGFDRSRVTRNFAGQLVYGDTNKPIEIQNIQFPNTIDDNERVQTAGLVNFIANYLYNNVTKSFTSYVESVNAIDNKIGLRVGGYTNKDKFNLLLDSRSPFNQTNVFVPTEDYKVFLNKSTATEVVSYSGIIIEKISSGFVVRGYDKFDPVFKIYQPIKTNKDPVIKEGGTSETFAEWDSEKLYLAGNLVRYEGRFYRAREDHTSGQTFDGNLFVEIAEVPTVGGVSAVIPKSFSTEISYVNYGTTYNTIQEVIDFIAGYEHHLIKTGFIFETFSPELETVQNWRMSMKDFLFWTTQNWQENSVITLSPAAETLKFYREDYIVDNIFNELYASIPLNSSGKMINPANLSYSRIEKEFILQPKDTLEGIFFSKLPLTQKEHIVLLNNETVFKDIIYNPVQGYRQKRIKVLGYRSSNWDGSINVPGFIIDDVTIYNWEENTDYRIGDIVKFKKDFYVALENVPGTTELELKNWAVLDSKPESKMSPNLEYKINQFADFYDLDTDNFDVEQQRIAQHLIGYQKRSFLQNIIKDDVSQYKFYQGYIQEKGTKNSLTKLFDALSNSEQDSLEFYEEWALRTGSYGAIDGIQELEYILDESKFRLTPQPIEITTQISDQSLDLIYRQSLNDAYLTPEDYNTNNAFPSSTNVKEILPSAGYVNSDDVDYELATYTDLTSLTATELEQGDYFWIGNVNNDWDVFELVNTDLIPNITTEGTQSKLTFNKAHDLSLGDIFIIASENSSEDVFRTVLKIENDAVYVASTTDNFDQELSTIVPIRKFESRRYADITELSAAINKNLNTTRVWVDTTSSNWGVYEKQNSVQDLVYNRNASDKSSGWYTDFDVNSRNTLLAVGDSDENTVTLHNRGTDSIGFIQEGIIEQADGLADTQGFGNSVAVSKDGKYIAVGSPSATNIKTKFAGNWTETENYNVTDVVKHNNSYWTATQTVLAKEDDQPFNSYHAYPLIQDDLSDSTTPNILLAGNYPLTNTTADHFLIRATEAEYKAVPINSELKLNWNRYSVSYINPLVQVNPFEGTVGGLDYTWLTGRHAIVDKVDYIFKVDFSLITPVVGDIIQTDTGQGEINYIYSQGNGFVVYLKNTSGSFTQTGTFKTPLEIEIGEYTLEAPTDSHSSLGGYWMISTDSINPVGVQFRDVVVDNNPGLIVVDILKYENGLVDSRTAASYYSIGEDIGTTGQIQSGNDKISLIGRFEAPDPTFPAPAGYEFSNKWFVRLGPTAPNYTLIGQTINLQENTLLQNVSWNEFGIVNDLNDPIFNNTHTVTDYVDGYLKVQLQADQVGLHNFKRGDQIEIVDSGAILTVWHASLDLGTQEQTLFVNWDQSTPSFTIALGSLFSDSSSIIRKRSGEVDRTAGFLVESSVYNAQVNSASNNLSKLIVFDSREHVVDPTNALTFDLPPNLTSNEFIENYEYWVVPTQLTQLGADRPAQEPTPFNQNWKFTSKLSVEATGTNGAHTNTGFVSIYERLEPNVYSVASRFVLPYDFDNFGEQLKFTNVNGVDILLAKADDQIVFVKNGTEGDVTYDWELSLDPNFRGEFDSTATYYTGDIVIQTSKLYQAQTVSAGAFDIANWLEIDNDIDYTGYIPKTNTVGSDSRFTGFTNFGSKYEVSDNGQVLAVYAENAGDDDVTIYRYTNNSYRFSDTISIVDTAVNDGEYLHSFALSADGKRIAIGSYKEDTEHGYDSGFVKVYNYNTTAQEWQLAHTLLSPQKDDAEQFGFDVAFIGNNIAVSSLFGNKETVRSFSDGTIFDGGFTRFVENAYDIGQVYVFEEVAGNYLYSYEIDLSTNISKEIRTNKAHLYGIDRSSTTPVFSDIRIIGTSWTKVREQLPVVQVNKFKGPFIYDKAQNEFISNLEIIDPLQGKISGVAEQELRYKSKWDPAIYTNVSEDETLIQDSFKSWGPLQVGQLWWDITNARFKNAYQGTSTYQANNWNTLFPGASIDIYEWVESDLTPEAWDEIADTEEGLIKAISGQVKNGYDTYVSKKVFDSVKQTFKNKYYFWVKNKKTIPNVQERVTSAFDVAQFIADPRGLGIKFIELHSPNRYVVNNMAKFIKGKDTVVNFTWWTIDNQEQNIHNQYQLLSDGLYTSKPYPQLTEKWFDSLIGFDKNLKEVPDPNLSPKLKYGTLSRPRQSWFINRLEALKIVIERANLALSKKIIVDDYDISKLKELDQEPSASDRLYDHIVDADIDLQFIGTNKFVQAVLEPVFENGKLDSVNIVKAGNGYIDPSFVDGDSVRKGPKISVVGTGTGAEAECTINAQGKIISVRVISKGSGYDSNSYIDVRGLTALIRNDITINNKWALAQYNSNLKLWERKTTQNYDVTLYWDYVDWFAPTYNQFTEADFIIEYPYQLEQLDDTIGSIVKINNTGNDEWLLLKKVDDQFAVDYSVNYETVGRQNGTVKIDKGLYDFADTISGFDGYSYDTTIYDGVPVRETRIILETIFDNIFVDELEYEYNQTFIASLRYILSEGQKPDWLFKTSFVKAKHNFGELEQKVHFQNDNLESYEDYVNEVKPFKTTLREYVSSYEKVENSRSQITDFDLMPWYDEAKGKISPKTAYVQNGSLVLLDGEQEPWKSWFDNATYYVDEIQISNRGTGFVNAPLIDLQGGGGTGAKAVAYISRGKITTIEVTHPGSGYTSAPTVVFVGNQEEGSVPATATAIIKNDTIRKTHTTIKFDRISGQVKYLDLSKTETFTSTTNQQMFTLTWPMDLNVSNIEVTIDGEEALQSEYTFNNKVDANFNDYTIYKGYINFTDPLIIGKTIVVKYSIDPAFLSAADRIQNLYKPVAGMPGFTQNADGTNNLNQMLDGIDYGGVEITSFDFDTETGWDADEWYSSAWDTFSGTFEDEIIRFDGTTTLELTTALESGIVYNVYINNVKVDDPDFGTPQQTNDDAILQSITGDGVTTQIDASTWGLTQGDIIAVRKITSDGTFLPDGDSYDSQLSGGTFTYGNAAGIAAGEIIIDGDGFVTPTTSKSTDEHVPGQMLDTVDIKVYDRIGTGQGVIVTRTHYFDGDVEYATLNTLNSQLTSLQTNYTTQETTLESLNSQLDSLNGELEVLEDNLAAAILLRDQNDLTQSAYLSLVAQVDNLQSQIDAKNAEISSLQSQLSAKQAELNTINANLTTQQQTLSTLEGELSTLNSDLTSLQQQLISAQNDLQNYLPSDPEYSALQAEISSLQSQIPLVQSQISSKQSQIVSVQSQIQSLESQQSFVQSQISFLQSQIQGITSQISSLTSQRTAVEGQISNYEFDYQQYVNAVNAAQSQVNNKQSEISAKQAQISTQTTAVLNIQNAIVDKQAEIVVAQTEIDALNVALDIGYTPVKEESLIVRLTNNEYSNKVLDSSDYTIDYVNKTVTLNTTPPKNTIITTLVIGSNGSGILDSGTFVGDGSTTQFLTTLTYTEGTSAFVTVDGKKLSVLLSEGDASGVRLLQSTEEYEYENAFILDFGQAPAAGSLINYTIYGQETQTFSEITIDKFTGDGSTIDFTLSQQPFTSVPVDTKVLVLKNNSILDTGYNTLFTATADRFIAISEFAIPYFSKTPEEIEVYINGELQTHTVSYRWYTENSTVELFDGFYSVGDSVEVYTVNKNYRITDGVLRLTEVPASNELINVYQFSEHDILDVKRSTTTSLKRQTLVVGTEDWKTYSQSSLGIIELGSPVLNEAYVWVALNGELLSPTTDYGLIDGNELVKIYKKINNGDEIDIVHFSGSVNVERFAYKIFKDILNRTHYKRINKATETVLDQPLNVTDLRIYVTDGSVLDEPNKNLNLPGVIFIDGERIEYFVKEDNVLRQVRRGTLGTGVNNTVPAGTTVSNQGRGETIPYNDKTIVQEFTGDGSTSDFELDFSAQYGVNQFEVFVGGKRLRKTELSKYNFNIAQTSPEADEILPPEFSVHGSQDNILRLLNVPEDGLTIKVVRKVGVQWRQEGVSMVDSKTRISSFLRDATSGLPE